jgi:ATP-dependent Clp protease protease subunit
MKRRKKQTPKPTRNGGDVFAAVKAADAKLTQTAMQLEYSFDRGVNFKDRSITIVGDLESPWFDIVDAAMSEFERVSKKTVTIKIYSEGGYVSEATAIVGRLRKSKCHIVTEGYGIIASAATIILACGDRRKMSQYAQFMHHESSYGVEGRHSQNVAAIKQAEKEEKLWSKWMARFSKKTEKFWYEWGQHIDKWLWADDCVKYGVVDEVLDD